MSTIQGKVKWFNGKKGYGFIERDDKEKDAFVHASAVKAAGMRYLNEGDKLEFTLEDGPKGPSAVNLKKLDKFFVIIKRAIYLLVDIRPFSFRGCIIVFFV